MKGHLDNIISRNTAGLDDATLKKLLLAYYRGYFLNDTTIKIEMNQEDFGLTSSAFYNLKRAIYTNKLSQAQKDILNNNKEKTEPFDIKVEKVDNLYYLYITSKGMVEIISTVDFDANGQNDKLLFYPSATLDQIYRTQYIPALEEGTKEDNQNKINYANSIKDYLGKCYTYHTYSLGTGGENNVSIQIRMYSKKIQESIDREWEYIEESNRAEDEEENLWETILDWFGKGTDQHRERKLVPAIAYPVEEQIIEYGDKVQEYTNPVQLMIYLLEISESKEFINSFIETVGNISYTRLKLYNVLTNETTYETEKKDSISKISGERSTPYEIKVVKRLHVDNWHGGFFGSWEEVNATDYPAEIYYVNKNSKASLWIKNLDVGYTYRVEVYYKEKNIYTAQTGEITKKEDFTYFSIENQLLPDSADKEFTSGIIEETIKTVETQQLGIALEKAKTWYSEFVPQNTFKKTITISTEQGTESSHQRTVIKEIPNAQNISDEELEKMLEKANAEAGLSYISLSDDVEYYNSLWDTDLEIYVVKSLETIEAEYSSTKKYSENDCLNVQFNYTREKGSGSSTSDNYLYTSMYIENENRKKLTVYKTYKYELIDGIETGVVTVTESYGEFLGLLANSTGVYQKGAIWSSDSKLVKYKSLYSSESEVALLLINGADMLFELLESDSKTEGFSPVFRYILHKFSNNDYGVTEWNYELFSSDDMIDIAA